MNERHEIPAKEIEHQFGVALVEAAGAMFSHVAAGFTEQVRSDVRKERDEGAALIVQVQLRPTPLISCFVERIDGTQRDLFTLAGIAEPLPPVAN